jgi:mortality factor 4-like protein 1
MLEQIIQGLCMYFDKALGPVLLYRCERRQYHDIQKTNSTKDLTDIYGAEHLLRLFGMYSAMMKGWLTVPIFLCIVQLPNLVAQTSMTEDTISVLNDYLMDILQYLSKRQKQLFVPEYQNATPAYISLVNHGWWCLLYIPTP